MCEIYEPAEDSYFLSEILKKEIPKLILKNKEAIFFEVGAGSGANLEVLYNLKIEKEKIFSCDINMKAVEHCKALGFNCIYSDLFQNVRGKYDVIIFNPPYLPKDKREPKSSKIATTGGRRGDEVIKKFLMKARDYLKKDGKVFLLLSSLTPTIDFENFGYSSKLLGTKKLFYEELFVFELFLR